MRFGVDGEDQIKVVSVNSESAARRAGKEAEYPILVPSRVRLHEKFVVSDLEVHPRRIPSEFARAFSSRLWDKLFGKGTSSRGIIKAIQKLLVFRNVSRITQPAKVAFTRRARPKRSILFDGFSAKCHKQGIIR